MISVGQNDKHDNLLILGGHTADLWKLKNKTYVLVFQDASLIELSEDDILAIQSYNVANDTKLTERYIEDYFIPWTTSHKIS